MSPRRPDPFKPRPGVSYSKGAVDRAGRFILSWWDTQPWDRDDAFDGWDFDHLVEAFYAVTWWRSLHARPLSKVAANLRYHVEHEGGQVDGRTDVTQRLKRRHTMIDKLEREPTMTLTQMHDIGGVRARLPSVKHVYSVSRRLRKTWTVIKTRDYIAQPKPSGYRALHHTVRRDGYRVEVQLRTVRQDAWANQVEEDGRRLGVGSKFGSGDDVVHSYYIVMSEAFARMDEGVPLPDELVRDLRRRYDRIRTVLPRENGR